MKSVLIVDDCEEIHRLIKGFLLRFKINVLCAYSGREALEALSRNKVDLIVCDLQMENGDGLWLITELDKIHHELPLLVFTAKPCLAPIFKHQQGNVFDKSNVRDLIQKIEKVLFPTQIDEAN